MLAMRLTSQSAFPFLLLLVAGCGGSDRTLYHVQGTVTFDGQPVPAGTIFFEPDAKAGNDGTQGFAEIKNGRYDTAESLKGVTGGAYQVRVNGFQPPAGGAPPKILFKDFRQSMQLPKGDSVQEVVVPLDAASGEFAPEIT